MLSCVNKEMGVTVGVDVDTGVGVRVGGKGEGVSVGIDVKVGTGELVGRIVGLLGTGVLVGVGLMAGINVRHASKAKDVRRKTEEAGYRVHNLCGFIG